MRVWAEPPRADGVARVAVETGLLAGVQARGPQLARLVERNAREPGLSSLCWRGETQSVSLRAAVLVRPGDGGSAARRLAHAALLQAGESLRAADALALEFPGARTPHRPAAAPPAPAEQTEAWRVYARAGDAGRQPMVAAVAKLASLAPAPWQRVTRAAHGIDAEIVCAEADSPGEATALLRVSATQPHPQLGAGLLFALIPPAAIEPVRDRVHATAALLNEAECNEWTGCDQLGGWCVHPAAGLAHVTFVPALAVEDDTAATLAGQAAARARWAMAFAARVAPLRSPAG